MNTNQEYVKKWMKLKNSSLYLSVIGLLFLIVDVFVDNEPAFLEIMQIFLLGLGVPLSFISDFYIRRQRWSIKH